MKINSKDSFKSLKKIKIDNKIYKIFSLKEAEKNGLEGISKLPKSIKVLLENLLRFEDEKSVKKEQILSIPLKHIAKNYNFLMSGMLILTIIILYL